MIFRGIKYCDFIPLTIIPLTSPAGCFSCQKTLPKLKAGGCGWQPKAF